MKKLLLALLLIPSVAFGQVPATDLMGLGMPAQLAEAVASIGTGSAVLNNNVALKGRNLANSANIDIVKISTSNAVTLAPNSVINIAASGGAATFGGGIVLATSGATISVQEATAATACMGVATPNGTTPVAVTTSCATTGARVFFSRAGAVTNMGTITTTTAPSGTGFSFASTGASDTLASSVIYLIVKESA
jgi:hypothetical protein